MMQIIRGISLTLTFFVLSGMPLSAQTELEKSGSFHCSQKKSLSLKSLRPKSGHSSSAPVHSFDVQKYTLDLDLYHCHIAPYPNSFTGSVTVDFRVDSTLSSIRLDAGNFSLIIDSVTLNAQSYTHSGDILTIQLDNTYQPGSFASVKIWYRHKDVNDNAFYSSNGFVFTDNEPDRARMWFPCWDKPSDKALLELTARVKSNVRLGSNGILADSVMVGDTLIYHWVSNHPVATYLTVISSKAGYLIGKVFWEKPGNPADSIPILFYYNATENPFNIMAIMPEMTDYFSTYFTEHPFDKNGFATLNNEFQWGGMENQTLTSLCPGCWSEGLIAHEFAHQWFGDMVTCATWADIWLNEGFATWSEPFWYEHTNGYATYKSGINEYANYYLSANPGWPISDPAWAVTTPSSGVLFNYAITYCKAACVVHQLRYVLGDSLFFDVLRGYCGDSSLRYHSATIPDFMARVNEISGEDYDWFFNQWLFQPNHPYYSNTYNFQPLGNSEWKVNFNARQSQTNNVFFKMPIELMVRFADGSDTTFRVMNDVNDQYFSWIVNKQPVVLFFDPDRDIVLKSASTIVGDHRLTDTGEKTIVLSVRPNPANSAVTIRYNIPIRCEVTLTITDNLGRLTRVLVDNQMQEGTNEFQTDFGNLAAGTYICTLRAGNATHHQKIIVNHP